MIYVDHARQHPTGIWCHMIADTRAELHDFAAALHLPRSAFFGLTRAAIPYYPLRPSARARAMSAGALSLIRLDFVAKIRELRGKGWP